MLVVAELGTFGDHFVDNVEIFSAVLVADAATGVLIRSLAVVSCHSSCFVVTNMLLAFVSDLGDIRSYAGDSYNKLEFLIKFNN